MKTFAAAVVAAFVFAAGMVAGTRIANPPARLHGRDAALAAGSAAETRVSDRIRLTQSATAPETAEVGAPSAESLADPSVRASLEKNLRSVPYAVLKQIYLERQDIQWERLQARYAQPKATEDAEIERRADRLFEVYQRNSGGGGYYVSRGELRLRGGKTAPYLALVEYYSANSDAPGETKGKDFCYGSTLYVRIGGKYVPDGQSTCLSWVAVRNGRPFALYSNYHSKLLVPYFDSISVALPGFGADSDVQSEWYDASENRWTPIGSLRWDSVSKDEFASLTKDIQFESATE